jgi:cytosine/adenosine deaminase-related metal-dependent hydrolase
MPGTLIRNTAIITMDAAGDIAVGDVLVEGDAIAAIEPAGRIAALDAEQNAEVVDGSGFIVIPGLVNAHLHTWQTALRGIAADWSLPEYFKKMHAGLATVFKPDDLHIATLMGALNQLNCGTTTLVDWCHNNPTPEHDDAAIDALYEAGIRAAFLHGSPKPDPARGERPFWEIPHPKAELERLTRRVGGLVSLGAAILGPHYSNLEVTLHDFRMARELGLIASMHQGGGAPRCAEGWRRLEEERLLGPCVNIVHGNSLSDEHLAKFCDAGVSFTIAPGIEMNMGHGLPITGRLRELGRAPSVGIDIESAVSGEMLLAARTALETQRALDHGDHCTRMIPAREALAWATVEGARMLGRLDSIGSLAPGKQADLVMIDANALNMQPVHDPVSAVVMQASLANVDSVMVAGRWKKRGGRLLVDGLDGKLAKLRESGERILHAIRN